MSPAIKPGIIYPSNIDKKTTEIRNEFQDYLFEKGEDGDIEKIIKWMGQIDRLELQKHIWNDDDFPINDEEVEI